MELPYGDLNVDKKIRSCKSFGGPVKLGFSICLPVLRSGKSLKVFPMSATTLEEDRELFVDISSILCLDLRFKTWGPPTFLTVSNTAPHTSPFRASYGVSVVKIWDKIDDVILITAPHCTQIKFFIAQLWKGLFGIFCKLKCFSYACHCHITIISMG